MSLSNTFEVKATVYLSVEATSERGAIEDARDTIAEWMDHARVEGSVHVQSATQETDFA